MKKRSGRKTTTASGKPKKTYCVRIDPVLRERARALDLNLSLLLEEAIQRYAE